MKISSSHHRFGLWWLCYLCLCCFQNTFWPLFGILPFLWIYRCLILVCRAEGVATTIGLGCVSSLHIAYKLPFCFWLRLFLSSESAIFFFVSLVSCVRRMAATSVHVPLRLPFYLWLRPFPSYEFAIVYLPRLLCRKSLATVISVRCESTAPRRWWTVTFL